MLDSIAAIDTITPILAAAAAKETGSESVTDRMQEYVSELGFAEVLHAHGDDQKNGRAPGQRTTPRVTREVMEGTFRAFLNMLRAQGPDSRQLAADYRDILSLEAIEIGSGPAAA